ncbi:MAG: hypothetical protein BroJett018_53220 [Chloroflexota bacterium]|nr:MAG: hypothetical protein BroJett018_53220 [Chloroflexota bacterium]
MPLHFIRKLLASLLTLMTLFLLVFPLLSYPIVSSQEPTPIGETAQDYLTRGLYCKDTLYDTPCAIAALSKAIELDPTLIEAYLARGEVYYDVFAFPLAIDDFTRALELDPNSVQALAWRGSACSFWPGYAEDLPQAEADLIRAYELDPHNSVVLWAWGDLYFFMRDEAQKGMEYYAQAVAANPNDPVAYALLAFGGWAMEGSLSDINTIHLTRAIEVASGPYKDYLASQLQIAQGQFKEAWAILETSMTTYPNSASLFYRVGQVIVMDLQSHPSEIGFDPIAKLIEVYSRAIELAPMSPRFYEARAYAVLNNGVMTQADFDAALADFTQALTLYPAYNGPYEGLTRLYLEANDFQDCTLAHSYFEQASAHPSEMPMALHNLKNIESQLNEICGAEGSFTLIPAESPAFPVGAEIELKGIGVFPLDSAPGESDGTVLCMSGSTGVVVQTGRVVEDGPIFVQVECEAGTGWIAETLLK